MSLRLINRLNANAAIAIFSTAVGIALAALYITFDFYLSSVGREVVQGWLQAEAVAMQEGNLLSSITKNQRILLSSQFVKGVTLFDTSSGSASSLIEIGAPIVYRPLRPVTDGVNIEPDGLFRKRVVYGIPGRPDLTLIFGVESLLLKQLFFAAGLALFLFLGLLFGSIKLIERREAFRRERFLREALSELVDRSRPTALLERELPFLVEWWREKKAESDRLQRLAIESESKIFLGELAARVAHDIRSPLNTLNAVAATLPNAPEEKSRLLKDSIQRIRDIANGIVDYNRQVLYHERKAKSQSLSAVESRPVLVFSLLEALISEKRLQYKDRSVRIDCDIAGPCYRAFVLVNALELRRTLSNIIDNAVESLAVDGTVSVVLAVNRGNLVLTVTDNGRGMSPETLARLGEKGFTYGKTQGTGLGVYYAKGTVESFGGEINFASTSTTGTTVTILLPMTQPPLWFAEQITIRRGATVLVVDDDATVHAVCREVLKDVGQDIDILHFFDPKSVMSWYIQNKGKIGKYQVLTDFDLKASDADGIDLIERIAKEGSALLVTSAFEDQTVLDRCAELNVKILPKPALPFTSAVAM